MKILPNERMTEALRCPICKSAMQIQSGDSMGTSLICNGTRKHTYDVAASGYVNLMPSGKTDGGDSKQAVRARREFLSLELYRQAADALAETVKQYVQDTNALLIDAGCGEGYYTAILGEQGFSVTGVDLSRSAVDSAAKRAAKQGISHGFFGVASVYELPFADESADAVVNVFAPCAEREFYRVLKPNGVLIVTYAGPDHLMGLKRVLYDRIKENDGRADLPQSMTLLEEKRVSFDITVKGKENLQNLFAMTPYYWRTSPSDSEKLKEIDTLKTAVDMIIAVYQKSI